MSDETFRRRDVLKQSSALTITSVVGLGGVATADDGGDPVNTTDVERSPDLVLINNTTEEATTEITFIDEDTGTMERRLDVKTRGFNHPDVADESVQNRRGEARHVINRLQSDSKNIYRVEATFKGETATGRIYVGRDGAPEEETFTITVSPTGRITANTVVSCE